MVLRACVKACALCKAYPCVWYAYGSDCFEGLYYDVALDNILALVTGSCKEMVAGFFDGICWTSRLWFLTRLLSRVGISSCHW